MAGYSLWFVNKITGNVVHVTNVVEGDALKASGVWNWYSSQSAAQASSAKSPGNEAVGGAESVGGSFLQFLDNLTSRALWVRIAKVTIGMVMVLTGINKLTGASNVIDKVAGVAGKAALV